METQDVNHERVTLKALRERAGLTQQELASRLNLSLSAVRNWERGEKTPQLKNAVELAKLLDVDLNSLCEAFNLDAP